MRIARRLWARRWWAKAICREATICWRMDSQEEDGRVYYGWYLGLFDKNVTISPTA